MLRSHVNGVPGWPDALRVSLLPRGLTCLIGAILSGENRGEISSTAFGSSIERREDWVVNLPKIEHLSFTFHEMPVAEMGVALSFPCSSLQARSVA